MSAEFLNDLFGMQGEVAVVIGGTGVLGGAIADGLGQAGAHVIVAGRDPSRGMARSDAIAARGGRASYIPVDVRSRHSIEQLLASALIDAGRVDYLVNCAGVNQAASYLEVTDDDWERVIETNLTSTHYGCQVFGKYMVESGHGGAILNVGSVSAARPLSRVFAYSASKAAVLNLTQNVARELAPHGVRVNAICPGFFPAEQNRKILDPQRIANVMRQSPLARFGEPHELVGAVLLLLSRKAGSFITGSALYVDGGFTSTAI